MPPPGSWEPGTSVPRVIAGVEIRIESAYPKPVSSRSSAPGKMYRHASAAGAAAILLVVAVGRRAHHAPASLGFGVGAWIAEGVCLWFTAHALHIGIDAAVIPLACLAAAAIMAIPLVPGGVGTVEAAVPFILATGSTSYAEAALVVLVWRVLSFWIPTAAGAGALASLHRRPSRVPPPAPA